MSKPKQSIHVGEATLTSPSYMTVPRRKNQLDPNIQEIVFWDERNPRCVVNLVSEKIKELALKLPPAYLALSAKELEAKFDPSMIERELRIAFWDEYFITMDNNSDKMRMAAVYGKVCSKEYFYQIMNNETKAAWILKPPENYMLKMHALLDMGLDRLVEILKMPLEIEKLNPRTNETYKVYNTKLIPEIIKAVAILDNRVKGAVPQHLKIDAEQKNLHLHANADYTPPEAHQDIEKELREIQRRINVLTPPQQRITEEIDEPIEVTASSTKT